MSKNNFRIGTTSYIYPDTITANLRRLKDQVDDIEFLLFEMDAKDNYPPLSELQEMKKIKRDYDLTYTIHMPLDISLGSSMQSKRRYSAEKVIKFLDHFSILDPHSFILHLNLSKRAKKNIKMWQDRVNDSLDYILKKRKTESAKIAIENLDYSFSHVESIIVKNNLSVCVDIGHLIIAGVDVEKHLSKYINKTRVIHFHGVNKDKDHVSLKYFDKKFIKNILQILKDKNYQGVLTLEVFSQDDFEESIDVLNQCI